jgi:hypothetical protein
VNDPALHRGDRRLDKAGFIESIGVDGDLRIGVVGHAQAAIDGGGGGAAGRAGRGQRAAAGNGSGSGCGCGCGSGSVGVGVFVGFGFGSGLTFFLLFPKCSPWIKISPTPFLDFFIINVINANVLRVVLRFRCGTIVGK